MLKFAGVVGMLTLAAATVVVAQPPPFPGGRNPRGGGDWVEASTARMMAFDENEDGKLSQSEVADPRLKSLFERADADKDGTVTKEELTSLFTREAGSSRTRGPGNGPGGGGPGGGGFGGNGPGGGLGDPDRLGPPGGRPPRRGEVLPPHLQEELGLTKRQRTQLEKLQQDVDARLAKILTEVQLQRLAEPPRRGPGGPPPRGPDGSSRQGPGTPPPRGPGDFGPPRDQREDAPPR